MKNDREMAAYANPQLGQHFLVSADKLSKLVSAADIRLTDDVLEVGAGIGTVARALPKSRSLAVVELDERLIGFIGQNAPHAKVLHGDALEIIQSVFAKAKALAAYKRASPIPRVRAFRFVSRASP